MARNSNSGHQLLFPPANCCPIFAVWTTQGYSSYPKALGRTGRRVGRAGPPAAAAAEPRSTFAAAGQRESGLSMQVKTLPLLCVSAVFAAETRPLLCVSAAFAAKTLPLL